MNIHHRDAEARRILDLKGHDALFHGEETGTLIASVNVPHKSPDELRVSVSSWWMLRPAQGEVVSAMPYLAGLVITSSRKPPQLLLAMRMSGCLASSSAGILMSSGLKEVPAVAEKLVEVELPETVIEPVVWLTGVVSRIT